jgi:2-iminobutanoate/2-iminopropanoate deaminase
MKSTVNTPQAPAAIGPYSQGTISKNGCRLLFTAGQIPINPLTGEVVGDTVEVQARQALENVRAIVEAAGGSLGNVLKTTIFMKNLQDYAKINKVYASYFEDHPPARSAVEVSRLPKDVLLEIEAVAELER